MCSDMSVEEVGSQGETQSAQSSQEPLDFKKSDTPASKKQKGELALLRELLTKQQKQSEAQQKQSEEQLAVLKGQLEEQRKQNEEQGKMLRQLLDRQ